MSPDDNKAILRAYVETIFNQQQVDRADELVAADYVDHAALPGQAPDLEGAKFQALLPDPWVRSSSSGQRRAQAAEGQHGEPDERVWGVEPKGDPGQ